MKREQSREQTNDHKWSLGESSQRDERSNTEVEGEKDFRKERGGQGSNVLEMSRKKKTENCLLSFYFSKESRSLIIADVTITHYSF